MLDGGSGMRNGKPAMLTNNQRQAATEKAERLIECYELARKVNERMAQGRPYIPFLDNMQITLMAIVIEQELPDPPPPPGPQYKDYED